MEKDFYTAKEIIMGTRSEYQKNELLLKKLKDMVYSDDKEVKDLYFKVFKYLSNKDPKMLCTFEQNEKTLRGLLWKLEMKLGTRIYGRERQEIKKDINGKYKIGNYHYDAYIKEGMEEEFELLTQKILSSDFITKMDFGGISKGGTPEYFLMILEPNIIYIDTYQGNTQARLDYIPREDLFCAGREDDELDDEIFYHLLDSKVPATSLSDYHRQIIDNNPSTYKPVEIRTEDEEFGRSRFNLLINENDDKITLTKTKIRKR